jgi:hypothetical protein
MRSTKFWVSRIQPPFRARFSRFSLISRLKVEHRSHSYYQGALRCDSRFGPMLSGPILSILRGNVPGPITPEFEVAIRGAGLEPVEGAMNAGSLRHLISLTDALGGVFLQGDHYVINPGVIEWFVVGPHQSLIIAAVARANCDPATRPERDSSIRGAGIDDVGKAIAEVGKSLPGIALVAKDLTAVMSEAKLRASWWGAEAELTGTAASALSSLVDKDINVLLAGLVPALPKAAVLLAITDRAGAALKTWIDIVQGEDKSRGVTLELLLWAVPWVKSIDTARRTS